MPTKKELLDRNIALNRAISHLMLDLSGRDLRITTREALLNAGIHLRRFGHLCPESKQLEDNCTCKLHPEIVEFKECDSGGQ